MEHGIRSNRNFRDRNHNESEYALPNDINEAIRLKMQHYVINYTWEGKNYLSPIDKQFKTGGLKVLDVGCESSPSNLGFIQCDALYGVPFPRNTFDFIYSANMFTTWKETDWSFIIEDMVRCVKRGGWIELMEGAYDFINVGPTMKKLVAATNQCINSKGINLKVKSYIKGYLEATGKLGTDVFIKEAVTTFWGNNLGELAFKLFKRAHTSIGMHSYMGMTESEFEKMFDIIAQEVEEYRTYAKVHRFYAQKRFK
ncbi:3735_t:CDS:2 [Funneliformis geosporum]|uniref:20093_t:CDS:1 n=1 Tax=Funneliformis geosporum TaxID=1117311 RepID=A0A9W4SNE5_9GLOM|nr:20093_t:CDS:2 [Funneliformis geosporum]CAI2180669.1 3735_t:CDS:2 [Funneliformis geosporum]